MSDTVIKIENLYKEYRLGVIGHGTLYHDLQSWWAKLRGKEDPNSIIEQRSSKVTNRILALNDINLNINQGEMVGIIGKNGAGKSTLLKILSRVTSPTKGVIKVKGRIASLLEVGTGFHGELTGRENIYLNGAINGMNKHEVSLKLDEIVDFAGVDKFLDTPVKSNISSSLSETSCLFIPLMAPLRYIFSRPVNSP
jgi:lipopolysaccharide transport system ATP-binding protein